MHECRPIAIALARRKKDRQMTAGQKQTHTHDDLLRLVPTAPDWTIDWDAICAVIPQWVEGMEACPQDPIHHAEGNVMTHTKMVVQSLVDDPEWRAYSDTSKRDPRYKDHVDPFGHSLPERQAILFWTAIFHDVGKPQCTLHEGNGHISSKGHSRIGTHMARRFLWSIGSPYTWREALCGLIASHQLPFWILDRFNHNDVAVEISLTCNTQDLILHARADINGRECYDQQGILDNVHLAHLLFSINHCLGKSREFANDHSRLEFLTKKDRNVGYAAHEDFKSRVIMMSGLPGVGKDTWIAKHAPDLPVISLDAIRVEMGIKPTDNQGSVIQEAKERARVHLRAGQDFIWNGTNVTRNTRSPLLSLFLDYGAHTKIVYVEVDPKTHRKQNRDRPDAVPDKVLDKLIRKLEPPTILEAHQVSVYTQDTA